MKRAALPPHADMVRAMLSSDTAYEGVFYTAVRTTGIFCRPSCPARKPKPDNVEFYATAEEAMAAGFRPCLRCTPLQPGGAMPEWVRTLLDRAEAAPSHRFDDAAITAAGVDPVRLRRWFKDHYGMTFHAFERARRVGFALGRLQQGETIDGAAVDAGYQSVSGFRDAFARAVGTSPGRSGERVLLAHKRFSTPLGPMIAMAEARGVVMLEFIDRPALPDEIDELTTRYGYAAVPGDNPHLDQLETELTLYFSGELREFRVPLHLPGTPFQQAAWAALLKVPYGETRSYGQQAALLERPNAARAVGRANGQNRVSIVVPCHRIIGQAGALTGYGGGQPRKRFLLDLEAGVTGAAPVPTQAVLFEG